jgi:hypoxia up-regulated 1
MSDGSASALNYGVFRRKDITEKPQNLLIYDVGATKTTATLVEYQLEKKEPRLKVLGIGYDRTVGGRDVTEKLRKHLVAEFKSKHKTKGDILENPRAMAKLWKEAERVKQVLSANTEHFAQVESLFEDKDFKVKVSRELIEGFIKELRPTLTQPLNDALKTIDFKPEQVETIVLMGAGTRIPSIQQIVKDYFGGYEHLEINTFYF